MARKAFVTGSHAYGEPKANSDIDLVVWLSEEDHRKLLKKQGFVEKDSTKYVEDNEQNLSIRFGNLNLLICLNKQQYDTWRRGTDALVAQAPVTRDQAVKLFQKLRKDAEVIQEVDS